jgi:hypothetical protein
MKTINLVIAINHPRIAQIFPFILSNVDAIKSINLIFLKNKITIRLVLYAKTFLPKLIIPIKVTTMIASHL